MEQEVVGLGREDMKYERDDTEVKLSEERGQFCVAREEG